MDFRNGHRSRPVDHTVNTQQGHHQLYLYHCMSKRLYDSPLMVDQVRREDPTKSDEKAGIFIGISVR